MKSFLVYTLSLSISALSFYISIYLSIYSLSSIETVERNLPPSSPTVHIHESKKPIETTKLESSPPSPPKAKKKKKLGEGGLQRRRRNQAFFCPFYPTLLGIYISSTDVHTYIHKPNGSL
ncbi:hypothetical protein GGR50DRAFT_669003 [Xylaria sp. CBS 124048]|nr:hypothetical protein GGR50DRAFT_669003 [Xylaria sp. CBS 124048]